MSPTPILAGRTPGQFVDEQIAEYIRLGWKKEALREAFRASFNSFTVEDFRSLSEPKRNGLLLFLRSNGVQIALDRYLSLVVME
ncbi:hypothetical protein GcM1_231026 [Golovinomyces cichoracearum]|uniref:Uncharacterized protein n=1 Tax=Golovinomyces cichoracearum TaxID=62708 RepID=A0A420IMJ3_9PEZI|nr:hypothetical protein GcM1_231026 [Golovinomyces cichoracearum]